MDSSVKPVHPVSLRAERSRPAIGLMTVLDRQIPESLLADPESARRARLLMRFGVLGAIFGAVYGTFYLLIGHLWGALIIFICTSGVIISPFLMRIKGRLAPAGDFFCLILVTGFLGLSLVEGGVHGHALAWLVSVPLCSLILTGARPAVKWAVIAFLASGFIVGLDLLGVSLPVTYDSRWNSVVSAAGYLGLVVFLFILGLIFETGRASAFRRMQEALVQLEDRNQSLIGLNKEKNEFLGIAAHDLKNPLTVILGNAQLLKILDSSEQTRGLADMIVSASERMRHLITNLLDVNLIEEGKYASRLECCDMAQLVRQSVEHLLPEAARKNIEVRLGITEDVFILADSSATVQILDNLISNAVKYSPLNSTVYVHLIPESNHALVMVRDEGPGISEADQKRLFQKFSRLSACPTGGESSTGLGLNIAKKLAEVMKGTIECHSTLGAGATFMLRLPTWTEESLRAAPKVKPIVQIDPPKGEAETFYARN